MPLDVEGVLDRRVGGEDSLDRGLRSERLLLSLWSSNRQMRVLRRIVVPQATRSMKLAQCQPVERCPGTQSLQDARGVTAPLAASSAAARSEVQI
jgi:hypothetical protein